MPKFSSKFSKIFLFAAFVLASILLIFTHYQRSSINPGTRLITIANYGPHSSLEESIRGIKDGLKIAGFIEGENINIEVSDVSFDTSLIMQMVSHLKSMNPDVFVAQTTPVAQASKNLVKNIPIVFADITDPKEAGLDLSDNITGASDRQDVKSVIGFTKTLIPNAKKVGMLYSTSEANDAGLLKMMKEACDEFGLTLVAIPVEQSRDIPIRMAAFKNNVDFIYVGSSGPIQPSLPVIVSLAEEMKIPVINMNSEEVKAGKVFASFGISYYKVGMNAARLIVDILSGAKPSMLPVIYPRLGDHEAFISKKRAEKIGFIIPDNIPNLNIVD